MKVKHIDTFLFDHAHYQIFDGNGDQILLKVDYKNNQFSLERIGNSINKKFQLEIEEIAKNLLSRKHNVNFAEK